MPKFAKLRQLGAVGNAVANALTFITANWGLVVSVIAAVAAGALDWLRAIVLNPVTEAAAGAFLFVLWTIIGITILVDRRRPRAVRAHVDYRYGLTFEGMQPRYTGVKEMLPSAGSLNFAFSVRNFTQSPIRYEIENVDIRLGTRVVPRVLPGTVYGFMARGAGRISTFMGFNKEELTEFYKYNTLENYAKGTVDISYLYGPPEGPPERRFRVSIEFYLLMINDGESVGWQDSIISERDEPFTPAS